MTPRGSVPVSELPGIVSKGQCMGCGFCTISLSKDDEMHADRTSVSYDWLPDEEHWGPVLTPAVNIEPQDDHRICPGATMNMRQIAMDTFGREPEDPMVGEALLVAAGHANDPKVRKRAASGGLTTAIATHLFETGQIDACYCSAGLSPRDGRGFIARNVADLIQATGSHYHPVAFGQALDELIRSQSNFAFVGLPCEIAAMRQLIAAKPELGSRCVLLIGLFCGGINRFSGIARYLEHSGIDATKVQSIDYRDGVWPGRIAATVTGETEQRHVPRIRGNSRWNILHYMISFQGYWMLPRCRICPDQIADFADIAVGDPHLPRFKSEDNDGMSAVVARTERGLKVLEDAKESGGIALGSLSRDELVHSQGYTLENRRHAKVYAAMASRLGLHPPHIEVYEGLERPMTPHQHVYAFVDLAKIRWRKLSWLRPFYLFIQVFEYTFLTFSPRLIARRVVKLLSNR